MVQAVSRDGDASTTSSQLTTSAIETSSVATSAPTISIQTPVDRATFAAGSIIHFMGVAADAGGRDLSSRIVWSSSLQGTFGTGASITKVLSNGTHTITATVTDSRGRRQRSQIVVVVE